MTERATGPEALGAPGVKTDGDLPDSEGLALLPPQMALSSEMTLPFDRAPAPRAARAPVAVARPGEVPSDEALVLGIRRGDANLGRHLYKRLIRIIESTLFRVMGRGERDHNDLVQAAFEEVVRSIHAGRFEMRCSLTSWAATIACHVGLNAIRSRRIERVVFDRDQALEALGDHVGTSPHPSEALDARDELLRVRAALAAMPEGRAEAVILHDILGYGVSEIATLTGSTVAAAQSRLVRGRRELLERLDGVAEISEVGQ